MINYQKFEKLRIDWFFVMKFLRLRYEYFFKNKDKFLVCGLKVLWWIKVYVGLKYLIEI